MEKYLFVTKKHISSPRILQRKLTLRVSCKLIPKVIRTSFLFMILIHYRAIMLMRIKKIINKMILIYIVLMYQILLEQNCPLKHDGRGGEGCTGLTTEAIKSPTISIIERE